MDFFYFINIKLMDYLGSTNSEEVPKIIDNLNKEIYDI